MENSLNLPSQGLPEKAYLVVNARLFHLDKEVIKIGRNIKNDLVLNDPSVSRFHAEIRYEDSQFLLVDLGSSGGTFLNNQKVDKGVLFSGDIIVFAKLPIMFMCEGASIKKFSSESTEYLGEASQYPTKPETEDGG
ncbi:MAG: FHA domain-containing protein [Anaerolineales bacterium]|jgi:pSer/pThr/pTyr-binding forkhead associated (FHA) protein